MKQFGAGICSKIWIFWNLEIFALIPSYIKNYKIVENGFSPLKSSQLMQNFLILEWFKTGLCSKIWSYRNLPIFSFKIQNSKISNFFIKHSSLVCSCEISSFRVIKSRVMLENSNFPKFSDFLPLKLKIQKSRKMIF